MVDRCLGCSVQSHEIVCRLAMAVTLKVVAPSAILSSQQSQLLVVSCVVELDHIIWGLWVTVIHRVLLAENFARVSCSSTNAHMVGPMSTA